MSVSYFINPNSCDCINVKIKNTSKDSVYILSQSNSIYNWDTCFTYDITGLGGSDEGYSINITNVNFEMDNYCHRYIFIYPDSTFAFGARTNAKISNNKLYISLYANHIHVDEKEKIKKIKAWETTKIRKRNFVPGWEWKSISANKEQ
ncbi:MAG: hypothetical protein EOP51_00320 [Sphingobacteriales bacterium]|nr:MAG: hypothetical protein EOP51_00320 [Sphingobacteriales bacterium]